ncbi:hypothetical protein C7450_1359 [Chelatococcus asaccharovorans]|uniref:Uncharacterized protein n=1 Tax=Chelatococcus asaccharovorans TaxID=28210 RepID=A0A2V3TRB1_9HYPH|nr:hypothetical protein C7450_1359 [Chelatococcus asaccharovorans]
MAPQGATGATWQNDTIASLKNRASELGGTDVVTSGPTIQGATPTIMDRLRSAFTAGLERRLNEATDRGQSGMQGNEYADGIVQHDGHGGQLLKKRDDLGVAQNTIVICIIDNGPNQFPELVERI